MNWRAASPTVTAASSDRITCPQRQHSTALGCATALPQKRSCHRNEMVAAVYRLLSPNHPAPYFTFTLI
jgi:hypothetical protein